MPIPATLITAGLLGLVFLALTIRVVGRRVSGKIMIGDGGDSQMLERIRAHANFSCLQCFFCAIGICLGCGTFARTIFAI